jgi:hypothetical protein
MTHAAPAAHDEGEAAGGLALVVPQLFVQIGLEVTSVEPEPDNAEYGAVLVRTASGAGSAAHAGSVAAVGGSSGGAGSSAAANDGSIAVVAAVAAAHGAGSAGPAVRVRRGKVTPTKVGLFVTHWRRTSDGTTGPYDEGDCADVLLVTVNEPGGSETGAPPRQGVFAFPREALLTHGIVGREGAAGKRGFRVYPPWSDTSPGQATRTQRWQLEHFVDLPLSADGAAHASLLLRP